MTETQTALPPGPLTPDELRRLDAWWRAANYLSVGQIYLLDNPLLREPLQPEHVKPRLLGHWGTTPGLNFLYAHLNRVIRRARPRRDLRRRARATAVPAWSPTPSWRAPTREVYPHIGRDEDGMRRLFRQFSFPGGIPSHVAPETPGLDPRGRRARLRAGARLRRRVRQPGPARRLRRSATARPRPGRWRRAGTPTSSSTRRATARCCRSCTSTATRSPTRPCWPASRRTSCAALLRGYGHEPYLVDGRRPGGVHQLMAATLDEVLDEIARDPARARATAPASGRAGR